MCKSNGEKRHQVSVTQLESLVYPYPPYTSYPPPPDTCTHTPTIHIHIPIPILILILIPTPIPIPTHAATPIHMPILVFMTEGTWNTVSIEAPKLSKWLRGGSTILCRYGARNRPTRNSGVRFRVQVKVEVIATVPLRVSVRGSEHGCGGHDTRPG